MSGGWICQTLSFVIIRTVEINNEYNMISVASRPENGKGNSLTGNLGILFCIVMFHSGHWEKSKVSE